MPSYIISGGSCLFSALRDSSAISTPLFNLTSSLVNERSALDGPNPRDIDCSTWLCVRCCRCAYFSFAMLKWQIESKSVGPPWFMMMLLLLLTLSPNLCSVSLWSSVLVLTEVAVLKWLRKHKCIFDMSQSDGLGGFMLAPHKGVGLSLCVGVRKKGGDKQRIHVPFFLQGRGIYI